MNRHPRYQHLMRLAEHSHAAGRNPAGISPQDIDSARLYCYAFRLHTIGAFHATAAALRAHPTTGTLAAAHRSRALEVLEDLADQGMEPIGTDFRVVLSTFRRYHRNVSRVAEAMTREWETSKDSALQQITERFGHLMQVITENGGIHLTRDDEAPPQASFVVPNLGITIVPLVYGDHHSWNLAWLDGPRSDVPAHRHHHGVEIHLGYSPMRGMTILGNMAAEVAEGYAMPIPPDTRHGYANTSGNVHHLPFIFGSLRHAGWGVFLDVEAMPTDIKKLKHVPRDNPQLRQIIYLEREITIAKRSNVSRRQTLIPAAVTDRAGSGGLELSITRVGPAGIDFCPEEFRIISVVHGSGTVSMCGTERTIAPHDHFAIPTNIQANLKQTGSEPLVILDAVIKRAFVRSKNGGY